MRVVGGFAIVGAVLGLVGLAAIRGVEAQGLEPERPRSIFLVGDSTVKNGVDTGAGRLWGWGHFLGERIDPTRYRVENRALGGRSSRTYRTEGLWAKVVEQLRPGDFVLIQFGHNDGGPVDSGRARASLKGVGDETKEVTLPDKPAEVVHTYGWYLRRYVAEAGERGATPLILSPVPRNIWGNDGKVARANRDYGMWASAVAHAEGIPFVDLNEIVAARYEATGQTIVAGDYFTAADHTHTTEAGARLNAECVVEGLGRLALPDLAGAIIAPPSSAKRP